MLELKGKYNTAKVFTDNVEPVDTVWLTLEQSTPHIA